MEVELTVKQTSALAAEAIQPPDETELLEDRMRRALGLGTPNAARVLAIQDATSRHIGGNTATAKAVSRSISSTTGFSPAVAGVPSAFQQRVTELEQQLTSERQKHGEVGHLLQQTEGSIRNFEARLQHDALARTAVLDAARQATLSARRALDEALFEVQQRSSTKHSAKVIAQEQASQVGVTVADIRLDATGSTKSVVESPSPKKRGRPRTRPLPEPKPVRWWASSSRDETKS